MEHTDHHVGRLVDALEDLEDPRRHAHLLHHRRQRGLGRGDAERHVQRDDDAQRRHRRSRHPSSWRPRIDKFGTPEAYNHYAVGWAHAMDTPYQWTKQVASHWGGTRNGTIVHWPDGIKAKGEIRPPVQPRHRRRRDRPRRRRPAGADVRPRRPADATPGPQHAPVVRRCGRPGASRDAVLRDVRQPRHLSQGLDRRDAPQHAVGDGADAAHRRRRLGALRAG